MSEHRDHNCGLALTVEKKSDTPDQKHTIALKKRYNAARTAMQLTMHQLNRGNRGGGCVIVPPDGREMRIYKDAGRIDQSVILREATNQDAKAAMIHGRYGTDRKAKKEQNALAAVQPFGYRTKFGWVYFMHNGQLERKPIQEFLSRHGKDPNAIESDSDGVGQCIACIMDETSGELDLLKVIEEVWPILSGGHNGVILMEDEAAFWRDERGTQSFWYDEQNGTHIAVSESNPLVQLFDADTQHTRREIQPGEAWHLSKDHSEPIIKQIAETKKALCMFHYVYFSKRATHMDGVGTYISRYRTGEFLAEQDASWRETYADIEGNRPLAIVPVPNTALVLGEGYEHKSNIPIAHAIMRNATDKPRSFMEVEEERTDTIRTKYRFHCDMIKDYDIILIEDSIVRGSLEIIIQQLKANGFTGKIHVRIGFSRIFAPCFYGIDMSTVSELLATRFKPGFVAKEKLHEEEAKIADFLGVSTLRYVASEDMPARLRLSPDVLCKACITGQYPTPEAQEHYDTQLAEKRNTASEKD